MDSCRVGCCAYACKNEPSETNTISTAIILMNPYRPPIVSERSGLSLAPESLHALAVVCTAAAVICTLFTALMWLLMFIAWGSPVLNDSGNGSLPIEFETLSTSVGTGLGAIMCFMAASCFRRAMPKRASVLVVASVLVIMLGGTVEKDVYELLPHQRSSPGATGTEQ